MQSPDAKVWAVITTIIGLIALMITLTVRHDRIRAISYLCKANLHAQGFALIDYSDHHGGLLPKHSGLDWVKDTAPYIRSRATLHCPLDKSGATTSFILLPSVAGKPIADLHDTVIMSESSNGHSGIIHGMLGDTRIVDLK